jgi:hypothetical protein
VPARGQQLKRRDLGRRIDAVQVARKSAHRAHPLRQIGVADPGRRRCPPQRELDRDRRGAGGVHERGEVAE